MVRFAIGKKLAALSPGYKIALMISSDALFLPTAQFIGHVFCPIA